MRRGYLISHINRTHTMCRTSSWPTRTPGRKMVGRGNRTKAVGCTSSIFGSSVLLAKEAHCRGNRRLLSAKRLQSLPNSRERAAGPVFSMRPLKGFFWLPTPSKPSSTLGSPKKSVGHPFGVERLSYAPAIKWFVDHPLKRPQNVD